MAELPALDLDFVRSQFPAFSEPSLEDQAFFENAGGSYACLPVIERLTRFYRQTKLQPYGAHPAPARAGAQMDASHERLAGYLNIAPDELLFGPSTSQNTYVLARAFRERWAEGDEIIVTDQDHEANVGAWRRLADSGIVVREWSADAESGRLDPAAFADLLSDRTRLVAFTHCSNVVGDPNPVAEICALARQAGAATVVDGVSKAPHGLPDIAALGCDVYLFSLYKTYGPHQGAMAVRREAMAGLANQSHWFNDDAPSKRLAPAGPDHAQVAAAQGVADYFELLHARHWGDDAPPAERGRRIAALFASAERARLAPLLDFLRARNDLRILGPDDPATRVPTIALDTVKPPAELAAALAERGVIAGAGDFYAPRILKRLGVDPDRGVLRLSFVHYTSGAEIGRLIESLDAVL